MKHHFSALAICLVVLLYQMPGMSQDSAIDNNSLDDDIETALDNALRSIDLEFDFDFEPVEIDLSDLNLELDRLNSDLHYLDIDADQELLDDLDINIDIDVSDLNFDQGTSTDTDQIDHSENEGEHQSDGMYDLGTSAKHKGLKKIN